MKRLLFLLALLLPFGVFGQPFQRNSLNTNVLGTNLVWTPASNQLRLSGATPRFELWNTSGALDSKRFNISDASGRLNIGWTSDDGSSTLTLGWFTTDGRFTVSSNFITQGYLGVSDATNRLTVAGGVLLLDGAPISSASGTPVNNFYATTINAISNFFQVAKGGHLTITNNLVPQEIGASKLVATASNGALTNADGVFATRGAILYKAAGGWTMLVPSTAGYVLTDGGVGADPAWAATSGGGGAGVNTHVTALTWSGTNAAGVNCITNGETFTIIATNNLHFGTSSFSNLPTTSSYQTYTLCIQQDSTGGRIVSFTNSVVAWALGTPVFIETNASAVSVVYLHTHPFTNSMLVGVGNIDVR